MLFRPAESSQEIVNFYRRYLISTFRTNREYYNKQLAEQLSADGIIANGPFISMSDSFAKEKSIRDLVGEGVLCKSMLKLEQLHPDRKLYKHQVEAIRKAVSGNNLVITTGTGSGKTECFLLPVLNQLMVEKEARALGAGVRTLIIYPMNALVNDQIRRLREIFEGYEDEDITFGKFTGETEDKYRTARDVFIEREGFEPKKNELISREQMRNTPPNILITNYAMLEYLLLRPGDSVTFNETNAGKWRCIVLDEAHTYSGASGIEVGSLLKRVKAMLGRNDIQFMLTSATLGGRDDNPKIVSFAQSLCNSQFGSKSIVRSTTISPEKPDSISKLDFKIYRELAVQVRDNHAPEETLKWLEGKAIPIIDGETAEESLEKTLYSMIQHDSFYYEVRRNLLDQTKPLNELALDLITTTDDIADFIAVASNAQINGDKIFEARYHMFLRGIEGVFISLAPSNKLFVKKMETYRENPFDEDTEYKAYEISFCHNCEAIFIVGQTDDGYLVQLSKFDDEYEPEVYLIEGNYDPESDDEDEESDKKYLLCSKCGAIARASSLGGMQCGHEKKYYNRIIKVKDKGKILHSCPCCHAVNTQRSILRPYFLGNEAATAVIATALYNVLPDTKIIKKIIKFEDAFFGIGSSESIQTTEEHLVKQFLTFSDNRQAASFFASYLENTYQTSLLKRLMTKVLNDNIDLMTKGIRLSTFVTKLEELMSAHNICEKDERHKQAWMTVAREMINYKARNSLQNEGTIYFDLDIKMPVNMVLGTSADETTNLFKILLLSFMKDGAFRIPVTLTEAEYAMFSFGRQINGYQQNFTTGTYVKSWLPKQGNENNRTKLVQYFFPDKDLDFATGLLKSAWAVLCDKNIGAVLYDSVLGKYLLNLDKVIAKKVDELYICEGCKAVTPYNFKSKCACNNCIGKLVPYDVDSAKQDDHYKKLYDTLKIDTLVAKEHTAQLGSQKAYDYQNAFKKETINVLSCSTTFEMGVDVGTLETVFMRNMPPTPANYAQRAGRAGRSVKSAAYALTYCPNNSHDLNYFKNPVSMIKGTISPPAFNVNNEKVVLRHIFASAFSLFWRKYPELYKQKIGDFIESNGISIFKKYIEEQPEDLMNYLKHVVSDDLQALYDVDHFGWVEKLFSDDDTNTGVFVIAEQKYKADIEQLQNAYDNYNRQLSSVTPGSKEYNDISWKSRSVNNSIRTIKEQQLISFLSRNNLIPKYGFPVDTVELKSVGQSSFMDSLRLDRDLFTAISEYAPESQIVADGKLITSRYVRKLGEYEWPKYNYTFCDHCKTLNRTLWTEDLSENCKQCGHPLIKTRHTQYIIPKFGFIVDNKEPEPVGTSKPERTYKGAISYIGDGNKIENQNYSICAKKVIVGSSRMDELAVLNTSNFYICNECGYGEIFDDCHDLFKKNEHRKSDGYKCNNTMLTPYALGHEFQTDVVQIKFESENIVDVDRAWTILYSLLEGLSKCLHIDRNELSGCLHWYRNPAYGGLGNFDFILFDNTPGGAGYVRNLRSASTIVDMMKEGLRIVSECTCGGDAADTACYSCLCNYYNQKQHDILQRRYAIDFFNSVLNGMTSWTGVQLEDEDFSSAPSADGLRAVFNNDGQDQSSMTYPEIWEYLKMDTDLPDERDLITNMSRLTSADKEKPYYCGSMRILENNKNISADLIWRRSKVAFFLAENSTEYEEAKSTDWNVFCILEEFAPEELLVAIIGG